MVKSRGEVISSGREPGELLPGEKLAAVRGGMSAAMYGSGGIFNPRQLFLAGCKQKSASYNKRGLSNIIRVNK